MVEGADLEEDHVEFLVQRFVDHGIVTVAERDILIAAAVFAGGCGDGAAPFVIQRDGGMMNISNLQPRSPSGDAGNLEAAIGGPNHIAVIDQLLHGLADGHIADSEFLHQFRGPGESACEIIAVLNPAPEHLCDLNVLGYGHGFTFSEIQFSI